MAHTIQANTFVKADPQEKRIVIPDGIKVIGPDAFRKNNTVETVEIPESVTKLSAGCFAEAKRLKSVWINGPVKTIPEEAFSECVRLSNIQFPDSVESIGARAFKGCSALKELWLPANLRKIGRGAFRECTGLKTVIVQEKLETIEPYAFFGCRGLSKIPLPDSLAKIGEAAFSGCNQLREVSIPASCQYRNIISKEDYMTKVVVRKDRVDRNRPKEPANTFAESKKATEASGKSASSGAKGSTYHYNDQVSFELPKGYTHRTAEDNNGNTREEICYGKSVNDDGDETWEFTASILPGTFDTLEGYTREKNEKILDFYKRGLENSRFSKDATAPGTAVYAIRRPIRIFGRLLKFKVDGIAAVIDEDQLLCLQVAFQQDEADPAPEIRAFEHLMTVGNSIRVNGKAMDFSKPDPKKLVKELQFSYDEENDESSLNLGIDIRVKNGDGEETNAGTISISGKSEEGKKKVAAKKTDKKRAFVPIEQEGNRLIFGGCWSMELVSNCRLCLEPTEEETGGKRYIIKSGTRDLWQFSIADVKDKQIIQSAASEISQGVIEKLHDAQGLIDFELRSDDSLKIHLHASLAADGFSCAMVKVETPDGDSYALTSMLPEIDDIGEAMQKINDEELEIYHPFGAGWEAQWTLLMRMVSTIRSLDDPEPDDENWVIGGYEYALNPETEIIPGVRCRIPKSAIKISEHTYALTELGLDQSQQVTAQNILTLSFVHSGREDPFDRQTSEPHNRLMVTHLGKGFGSILREKRTEGFHACLGYIPINGGKYIIALIKDQLIAQIVIECGEQENHPIQYEAMQCAEKLFNSLSCGNMPEEAPYVFPPTLDFLHEHYDLVESGGYTTHRDADFTGQPIRMLLEKHDNEGEEAYGLMKTSGEYHLDRDAVSLAKVFRLDSTLFDVYGDTEALIRKGMFKDARCFEALRSLAWTVSCMADRSGRPIGDYSFEELEKIGELIKEQNYLNYAAFSYMPGLCDHYDWHVFYVPDEYIRSDYQSSTDLRYLTGKENRGGNSITIFGFGGLDSFGGMNRNSEIISRNEETLESLEALRLDLQTLLPVMETIHDGLLADRDRSEQLQGPLADALTAWCALAIAAREPFYSEEAADTYEADAGLDEPLERPTDSLDDKPIGKAKPAVKKAAKPQTKPAAKPAKPSGEVLDLGGETVIKPGQFGGNMTLKNIVIPEGVTEIGEMAFYTCLGLQSVVFPKSLKKIGKMAFMSCRALQKVELQEGVEEIETHAFGATNNLKEVHLPDSLKKVDRTLFGMGGDSPYATAFMSGALACRLMETANEGKSWPSDAIYARRYVIDGVGYEEMTEFWDAVKKGKVKPQATMSEKPGTEPETEPAEPEATAKKTAAKESTSKPKPEATGSKEKAESTGTAAQGSASGVVVDSKGDSVLTPKHFYNYDKCKDLIIPEGVEEIAGTPLIMNRLETVTLPKSLRKIGKNAFCGFSKLKSVTIQDGLETIGYNAIAGNTSLKEITLPDSIQEVDEYAFWKYGSKNTTVVRLSSQLADRLWLGSKSDMNIPFVAKVIIDGETYDSLRTYKGIRDAKTNYVRYIPKGVTLTRTEEKYMQVITALLVKSGNVNLSAVAFEFDETADDVKKNLQGLKDKGVLKWTSAGKLTGLDWNRREVTDRVEIVDDSAASKTIQNEGPGIHLIEGNRSFTYVVPEGFELDPPEERAPDRAAVRMGKKIDDSGLFTVQSWDYTCMIMGMDCNSEKEGIRKSGESPIQMFKRALGEGAVFRACPCGLPSVVYAYKKGLDYYGEKIICKTIGLAVETDSDHVVYVLDAIDTATLTEKKEAERFMKMLSVAKGVRVNGKPLDLSALDPKKLPAELAISQETVSEEDGFQKAISFKLMDGYQISEDIGQRGKKTLQISKDKWDACSGSIDGMWKKELKPHDGEKPLAAFHRENWTNGGWIRWSETPEAELHLQLTQEQNVKLISLVLLVPIKESPGLTATLINAGWYDDDMDWNLKAYTIILDLIRMIRVYGEPIPDHGITAKRLMELLKPDFDHIDTVKGEVVLPKNVSAAGSASGKPAGSMSDNVRVMDFGGATFIEGTDYMADMDPRPILIPEGVKRIGESVFTNCRMEAVTLPSTMRILDHHAFSSCPNLREVKLNEGLEQIDSLVFIECPKLTDITLPDSIKKIDNDAFLAEFSVTDPTSRITVRLSDRLARYLVANNEYPNLPAIRAKEFMINGICYRSLEEYVRRAPKKAPVRTEPRRQPDSASNAAGTQSKKDQLLKQIHDLEAERDSLRGLLAGIKRNKLQKQIDALKNLLRNL